MQIASEITPEAMMGIIIHPPALIISNTPYLL
jgi:hypothetical protein